MLIPVIPRLYAWLGAAAIIVALLVALVFTRQRLETEREGRIADRKAVAAAQAEARANDLAHAREVETAQNKIREEVSRDLETKLASARADADRYAARLRDKAAQGGGGRADLSFTPATPDAASGAGESAELDDARICAANTVIAEGWQAWWKQIEGTPR